MPTARLSKERCVSLSLVVFMVIMFWIICKMSVEKVNGDGADIRWSRQREDFKKFCEEYSSNIDWYDFQKNEILYSDEVKALKEELEEVIGIEPTNQMLFHAYLALDGKVPTKADLELRYKEAGIFENWHDTYWHIRLKNRYELDKKHGTEKPIPEFEELKEARKRFLIWYDKKLAEKGVPYRLKVCYLESLDKRKDSYSHRCELDYRDRKPVSEDVNMHCAVFFWEPTRTLINQSSVRGFDVVHRD